MPNTSVLEERETWSNMSWLLLSLLILVVDQLTKSYVMTNLQLYEVQHLFPGINLTLAYNTGAAFSFLHHGGGWQRWFFIVVGLGISIWLVVWLYKTATNDRLTACSLAMILGGAIGNIWDRVLLGYVVDFIDVYVGSWHWWTFNIADMAITVGATLLCVQMLRQEVKP